MNFPDSNSDPTWVLDIILPGVMAFVVFIVGFVLYVLLS